MECKSHRGSYHEDFTLKVKGSLSHFFMLHSARISEKNIQRGKTFKKFNIIQT